MQLIRDLVHGALEVPTMVQLLGVRSNRDILVLGCGNGIALVALGCGNGIALVALAKLRNPRSITGIDLDQAQLDQAQDRLRATGISAHLILGDVLAMPFSDRSFDLVVDFGVCYRVPQPAEALNEVSRVLRFGGMFAYESHFAQLLAHPLCFTGRLPWKGEPTLVPARRAVLWSTRAKRTWHLIGQPTLSFHARPC